MREIKFRAWIDDDSQESEELDFRAVPNTEQKKSMCYDLAFEYGEPLNGELAGVEHLMQFTGLKDKNGKEIWEGDVIKIQLFEKAIFSIIFIGGSFMAVRSDSSVKVMEGCGEVIGNVYENQEFSGIIYQNTDLIGDADEED